ncbi:MAG: MFS transporter [Pyrobaculum sp.]
MKNYATKAAFLEKTRRVSNATLYKTNVKRGESSPAGWGNVVALVTAAIITGIGAEVVMSIRRALVGDLITPKNRGRVMGATLALEYLGAIVGGVVAAYLYSNSPTAAFLFSGVVILLASIPLIKQMLEAR